LDEHLLWVASCGLGRGQVVLSLQLAPSLGCFLWLFGTSKGSPQPTQVVLLGLCTLGDEDE